LRPKLTVWKEEQFTVLPFQGIEQWKKRVAEWVSKALTSVKPGVWGCVQAREQWSTEEDAHIRPGHHWLCEFGDAGNGTICEKQFNLVSSSRKCFLQHLRLLLVCAREERDCEVLRVWVLKGLLCQWMMTLNSGHDVSE
jgi:hypothetical protein